MYKSKNSLPTNLKLKNLKKFFLILNFNQISFSNTYKSVHVRITISISSSMCKRSFPTLRRLKNWLHTSLVQG